MKPVPYSDIDPVDWNAVQSESPLAWLFHRAEWIDIETLHFGASNRSFALTDANGIAAIQPLYASRYGINDWAEQLLHTGIHRHTGLATASRLRAADVRAARQAAMERILKEAEELGADRILLNAHNLAPASDSEAREEIPFWVREYGFQLGLNFGPVGMLPAPGLATCNADHIIDLCGSEDALFADLTSACKRAVRKAVDQGIVLEAAADPQSIDRYYEIAILSAARTGEVLPSIEYYRKLWTALAPSGRLAVLFARRGQVLAAGLLLIIDKGSASFLAGSSRPDELVHRVNDFLHWSGILWAKRAGLSRYRLGPSFPEVPGDWPIARVSRFKTKFGGRTRTVIQGSRFLHPEKYVDVGIEHIRRLSAAQTDEIEPLPAPAQMTASLASEVVLHHLQLMGWPRGSNTGLAAPLIVWMAGAEAVEAARGALARGSPVVAICPSDGFCTAFGVTSAASKHDAPSRFQPTSEPSAPGLWRRLTSLGTHTPGRVPKPCLRTLHPSWTYDIRAGRPLLHDSGGEPAWLWVAAARSGILFVGTDLAQDLVRYRQGDPALADHRESGPRWGYAGERPNYLFEPQREGEPRHARHADEWAWLLTRTLSTLCDVRLRDVLPGNAVGAVVITGDDDQASLDCYDRQLSALGDAPITYFLHPLTKHTRETLGAMRNRTRVDLGLHPDALEAPTRYPELFAEQSRWYQTLVGEPPQSVRNHGFLNDGYWGHLDAWMQADVRISSNLPGPDGTVLNGSLLPARVAYRGRLTNHWSLLTQIGDGVIFVNDWSAEQAARCVYDAADALQSSGIPGVIVLNLHPENIGRNEAMHRAAKDLIAGGFHPWTMRECQAWFEGKAAITAGAST